MVRDMVSKTFDVTYDDFSGGHFVGQVGTRQPKNTWVGHDVTACQFDGTLMPLEAFYSITATMGGLDGRNTCTRPLMLGSGSQVVWAGSAHAYSLTVSALAQPLAVTAIATPFPATPGPGLAFPSIDPVYFKPTSEVLYPSSTSANLVRVNAGATVVNSNATPAQFSNLIAWGQFVFGVDINNPYKVWFSNPGTATTWSATDFFILDDSMGAWCVHQGNLFMATGGGWYVATGIPNATLSIRQITTVETGGFPVSIDTTVLTRSGFTSTLAGENVLNPNGALIRELAGNQTRALNWSVGPEGRPPAYASDMARVGNFVVARVDPLGAGAKTDEGGFNGGFDLGPMIWVLDIRTGCWHRRSIPSTEGTGSGLCTGLGASDFIIYRRSAPTDNLMFARLNPADLIPNQDGTWPTGTVELCEYYHPRQFKIKEVWCEVDYGTPSFSLDSNVRSISVSVKTPGVFIEGDPDISFSRAQSSTLTQVLPSRALTGTNYTRRRSWVRFNPTDGADTFTATPVITLSGLKLRRCIVRCDEVG